MRATSISANEACTKGYEVLFVAVTTTARSSDLKHNILHAEQQAPFVFRHERVEPMEWAEQHTQLVLDEPI